MIRFFCHADFADYADFFSYSGNALCKSVKSVGLFLLQALIPLIEYFLCPTDFTD